MEIVDASLVCPIVKPSHPAYSQTVGGSTPMGEGLDSTPILLDQVSLRRRYDPNTCTSFDLLPVLLKYSRRAAGWRSSESIPKFDAWS